MDTLIVLILLVFGFAGYGLLQRHLRAQTALKRREMAHKERVLAMEKGLPLDGLEAGDDPMDVSPGSETRAVTWARLGALFLGLFLLATGIGLCLGFYFANEPGMNRVWTVGFIPILGGGGLLLFVVLSRSLVSEPGDGDPVG